MSIDGGRRDPHFHAAKHEADVHPRHAAPAHGAHPRHDRPEGSAGFPHATRPESDPSHAHPHDAPHPRPIAAPSQDGKTARTLAPKAVAFVAAVVFIAFAGAISLERCAAESAAPADVAAPQQPAPVPDDKPMTNPPASTSGAFDPSPASLDAVPADDGLQTFVLPNQDGTQSGAAPALAQSDAEAIERAIHAVEEYGDASIVFYSLENGAGIAYHADTAVYGASSFKAPYALYVCETQIETGEAALDDACPGTDAYDPDSPYNGGSYPLYDLIASAIVYSDNNAFGSLRETFDARGYDEWAEGLGLVDAAWRDDSWYPWYCARTSAKAWTEMYAYLQGGTDAARYLGALLGQTEVSFLRAALADTGAAVYDKAGWCADEDPRWNGLCDAGIVSVDGTPYIMSVMTGMPDGEEERALLEDLAAALFAARGALA